MFDDIKMEEELDLDFKIRKPLTDSYIQSTRLLTLGKFWLLAEELFTEKCGCFFMIAFCIFYAPMIV